MEDKVTIIDAIGKLWPFMLVIFFIVVVILKWRTIWLFIENLSKIKVKKGDTELEFISDNTSTNSTKDLLDESRKVEMYGLSSAKVIEENSEEGGFAKYLKILKERKFDAAAEYFEKILEQDKDVVSKKKLEVKSFYWRYTHGDTTAFEGLESYSLHRNISNDLKAYVNYVLSFIYEDSNDKSRSIQVLLEAIDLSQNSEEKASFVSRISNLYYESGKKEEAINILYDALKEQTSRASRFKIYEGMVKHYKLEGNRFLELLASQKLIECEPNNISTLFNAAYNYSDKKGGYSDIGLFIYKKVVSLNPKDENALNNMGVLYRNLNLPFKSTQHYKKSVDCNNSLAAANLASILIENGFREEAEQYLLKGQNSDSVHDNVYHELNELKKELRKEERKEKEIISNGEKKYNFLNLVGESTFTTEYIELKGLIGWSYNNFQVNITLIKNAFSLSWEQDGNEYSINGIKTQNSLNLQFTRPERIQSSFFLRNNEYEKVSYNGFGYIENRSSIKCLFEIENKINELHFVRNEH